MTAIIAIKELLLSITTIRFSIIVLVCCIVMPISVAVLSGDWLAQSEDYRQRAALEERRVNGKDSEVSVFRPVPPLSALFNGVSQRAINGMRLAEDSWSRPLASGSRNPVQSIFPTVDLTFIIGIILSGLAILLSHDAIAGEKADATLRAALSNPVSRASIVIGKWIGISAALIVPFLLGLVISLLLFFMITTTSLSAEQWLSVGLAVTVACVYLSAFVLVGIAVSAFARSLAQAIFSGLAIWGFLVIILPQLSVAAANAMVHAPIPQELEKKTRQYHIELNNDFRRTNRPLAEQLKARKATNREVRIARRSNEWPLRSAYRARQAASEQDYDNAIAAQEDMGLLLSTSSPTGSLNTVLATLADTGIHAQREFVSDARRYGLGYFDQLYGNVLKYPDAEVIAGVEKFRYRSPELMDKIGLILWPVAALILFMGIVAVVTVFRFNGYDVR